MKRSKVVFSLLLLLCVIGAVTLQSTKSFTPVIYNLTDQRNYTFANYTISTDFSQSTVVLTDSLKNTTQTLPITAFESKGTYNRLFYAQDNTLYLLCTETESAEFVVPAAMTSQRILRIVEISLDTFDTSILFEYISPENIDPLFALSTGEIEFFLDTQNIYLAGSSHWYRINRITKSVQRLPIPANTGQNIAFNGEYIFYLNELDNLCQYEVCTNKISVLSDAIIADFKLTETGICFTSYMDGDTTYCYSLENRTIHILTGSTC